MVYMSCSVFLKSAWERRAEELAKTLEGTAPSEGGSGVRILEED